ncbi:MULTISPECIES: two-component system response regulator NarL [Vibrio]|uniref:Two-component system response regulator NarL n=1 Tax=Vibrio casei TaxID=673372 RepID=A0A368LH71_9VIBR|nr:MULTISPECIES: two-component system response regulator NarL [Vibrio]RCS70067.1 two-component system response regulator NarL [Vibrio casei]SJN34138.1 Nitrate/nitrite response regulator protein [Vibrio casei]HBV76791.1 two-component system response regulator NarL [Vibrio sp.]
MELQHTNKSTILLIDDHPMLCRGVKHLIEMNGNMQVVAMAHTGTDGIALAKEHDPDLILLDLNMPEMNGLETLRELRNGHLSSRVVVFTVSNYKGDLTNAIKLGADGYLLKDMEPEELIKAIDQACNGQMVLSPEMTPILMEGLRSKKEAPRGIDSLTKREFQTLKLVATGMTNKMIARKLDIAEGTVKVHVKSLLKKLNLHSRVEMAVWVHEENIC